MEFDPPLVPGTLIKRYNRFLVDVKLDSGETITGSCPNTGSMLGLKAPGLRVWLSEKDSPTRKYRHTLELVEVDEGDGEGPATVGVNTGHPNKLVEEAIRGGRIAALKGYADLKREQKYGQNSRIDLLLDDPKKGRCYVEVKNVHLRRSKGLAEFPDSVTSRGAKHLGELADMVDEGHRAVMMFLIQRADVKSLSLARDIDPNYGEAFDAAIARGVEPMAYRCTVAPDGIAVARKVPVKA
ncbi:MAG: DNA/RNA nuclease SfsA [Pseudomonadota bacterium]